MWRKERENGGKLKVKGKKESRTKNAVNTNVIKNEQINHTSMFILASLAWLTSAVLLVFNHPY